MLSCDCVSALVRTVNLSTAADNVKRYDESRDSLPTSL